jgi:hypothetical protein
MSRNSLIPVSESALTEVLIKLKDDVDWGKNNEKLFMRSGNQNLLSGGFNINYLPPINSRFDFDDMNCYYYVSFDPNDPAFHGNTKYYSVNNLRGLSYVSSWKDGRMVPPSTLDLVITVGKGDKVRHLEVYLKALPSGGLQNGTRGATSITTNRFSLSSKNKQQAPNLHSNYNPTSLQSDVSVVFYDLPDSTPLKLDIGQGGTITGCGKVECSSASLDPNSFKSFQPHKDVPELTVSSLTGGINFEPIYFSSGTYELLGDRLKYTDDLTGQSIFYVNGQEIISGVEFKNNNIEISKNIMVEYDGGHLCGTGNLSIIGPTLKLKKGITLYAPGDGSRDPNTGAYLSGNIIVSSPLNKVVTGHGNICSMGTIDFSGRRVDAGIINEDNIALYAQGDISLNTTESSDFSGLIYTNGDFKCNIDGGKGNLHVKGTIIAAGKNPDKDPQGALWDPGFIDITAREIDIDFDDTVLGSMAGSLSKFTILCWYEF